MTDVSGWMPVQGGNAGRMRLIIAYSQSQDELCGGQSYLPTLAAGTGN